MDKTAEEIEAWLVMQVAQLLGVKPERLDIDQPLARYSLDSIIAIELTEELEKWLQMAVPETIVWDEPSIRAIARYLSGSKEAESFKPLRRQDAEGDEGANWLATESFARPQSSQKEYRQAFADIVEPIAIIGLSCRLPGANDAQAFWHILSHGLDALSDVPPERWNGEELYDPDPSASGKITNRRGGFLTGIDLFDPEFFDLSPREAAHMDPQQRLLLEVSWEALEHAGLAPQHLAGSLTGVFIGISTDDYLKTYSPSLSAIDAYTNTGNARSIAASRISYLFDFHGPSMAIDTACSSSLVALHLACQSLRGGESTLALAGGVNVMLAPDVSVGFSKARMMATHDQCKPFDASANGFIRGEGCGIVVLKRLSDAERDGDRILAIIRGSAINQNGRGSGLATPNSRAEQAVIRQALKQANILPDQVGYIVAQGTGTPVGDAAEIEALEAVFGKKNDADLLCAFTSVKANIGHLESAAGVVNVIAATLALLHQKIPLQLHFQHLNTQVSLEQTRLFIPVTTQPWPLSDQARVVGVNAFSMNGTNAHVVLEEVLTQVQQESNPERSAHVFTLSAPREQALKELVERYLSYLAIESVDSLTDICFTAGNGRNHFSHRLAVVANTREQLSNSLHAFLADSRVPDLFYGFAKHRTAPKVAFLLSSEGIEHAAMGYQLYKTQPVFRRALEQCAELLAMDLEQSLISILYPEQDASNVPIHESVYSQPALFSFEYALATLWLSWGVAPDAVLGCGAGAYVAACLSGSLDLEDALHLVVERSRILQNPARPTTVFARVTKLLPTKTFSLPFISTLTGQCFFPGESLNEDYWVHHLSEPLRFAESINTLYQQGFRLFLEIGPTDLLSRMGQELIADAETCWLSSFSQEEPDTWRSLLLTLGTLYAHGRNIDWVGIYEGVAKQIVSLPTYPFQREHCWHTTTSPRFSAQAAPSHPLLGKRVS